MAESELLAAIAGMLDEKLKPVIQKLTDLGDRISGLEGRISHPGRQSVRLGR